MFDVIRQKLLPNPLSVLLKKSCKEGKDSFLIYWNRGLGDIPLGLYALCTHIRKFIPTARIVFLTRKDLYQAFTMLEDVEILVDEEIKRGCLCPLDKALAKYQLKIKDFDVVIEKVDSKRWLNWQLGTLVPKLKWQKKWDELSQRFSLKQDKTYLGVHVSSETSEYYGYEKNWSQGAFQQLFERIAVEKGQDILLFGIKKDVSFRGAHILDLRGETTVFEMLSIIKNYCSHLLAPDSGVLSIVYYIDEDFPLKVVSLWADPRQGVLKQHVKSPNKYLKHHPLIGRRECIENISIQDVFNSLYF